MSWLNVPQLSATSYDITGYMNTNILFHISKYKDIYMFIYFFPGMFDLSTKIPRAIARAQYMLAKIFLKGYEEL